MGKGTGKETGKESPKDKTSKVVNNGTDKISSGTLATEFSSNNSSPIDGTLPRIQSYHSFKGEGTPSFSDEAGYDSPPATDDEDDQEYLFTSKQERSTFISGGFGYNLPPKNNVNDQEKFLSTTQKPNPADPRLQELFDAVKLMPPNQKALLLWSLFVLVYGSTVSVPAFYSLTEYASKAVQDLLAGAHLPDLALTILKDSVKIASVVPTILSANSGRLLLAHMMNQSHRHFERGGWLELGSRVPELVLKEGLPLIVSLVSSLGAGNVTNSRLKSDAYSDYWVRWCTTSTQISASSTNFRQLSNLAVDPATATLKNVYRQRMGDISVERDALQHYLKQYPAALNTAVRLARDALIGNGDAEEPLVVDTSLVKHYSKMRDLSRASDASIGPWLEEIIRFVDSSTHRDQPLPAANTWQQWLVGKVGEGVMSKVLGQVEQFLIAHDRGTNILHGVFVLTASSFTLPQYESAAEAGPFAASEGIDSLPGPFIGASSFSVNAFINFFSLWTLYEAVTQSKSQTVDRDWADFCLFILKGLLVGMYTISQLGIVKAFPFKSNFLPEASYPKIAVTQLVLAAFVATGLALFSISGAFEQVAAYKLKWQKQAVLDKVTEETQLTSGLIQAMLNELMLSAKTLMQRIEAVDSTEVSLIVKAIPNGTSKNALAAIILKYPANDANVKQAVSGCLPCCDKV